MVHILAPSPCDEVDQMRRSARSLLARGRRCIASHRCPREPLRSPCRRTIVGQAGQDYISKVVANASVDAVVEAITRPKSRRKVEPIINEPTLEVLDPSGAGAECWSDELENLELDLSRAPRRDRMDSWVADAGSVDPFKLVASDMRSLSHGIKSLIGSDHPILEACAKYFFELDGGKKIRPTMVLLVAQAAGPSAASTRGPRSSPGMMINGSNRHVGEAQRRLAEITEMIHTASLFHDDVIDEADARRGVATVNKLYGNKMAVLAGDFLLARASVSLARLRNVEVVELLSTVIEHLVKGEVMQSRPVMNGGLSALEYYLHKNYYKTGSLMANSCRAALMLAGHGEELQAQAFAYGRHVGLAFQLVDDVLDFEQSSETLGKPAMSDIKQGLATAPVLIAAQQFPELNPIIKRRFKAEGDVEKTLEFVAHSGSLQRAKGLALVQAEQAMEAVVGMAPSPARDGLVKLAALVVNRSH